MYLKSEATCSSKAVYYKNCSSCYYKGTDTYVYQWGQLDPKNHDGGEEVKNAKAATCTEKGYTGDTYCKGCNTKLSTGTVIPKLSGGSTTPSKPTKPTAPGKTVQSGKTGDAGVALYAGMTLLSLTGCAWLRRKGK